MNGPTEQLDIIPVLTFNKTYKHKLKVNKW